MTKVAQHQESSKKATCLYMAFELSFKKWKLAFSDGGKEPRIKEIAARDLKQLQLEIGYAKGKFHLPENALVKSCYEAGRDGFWLHRYLLANGVENLVVDSSSIEVNRRKRRAKTDTIDARKLYSMLVRYHRDEEHNLWSVCRVPSRSDEDERRSHREYERLQQERVAHNNRLKSLLMTQGIDVNVDKNFLNALESMRLWDDTPLSRQLKAELQREYARLQEIDRQMSILRKEQSQQMKTETERKKQLGQAILKEKGQMVITLMALCGIGERTAWTLVYEYLWRDFANRREVGNAAGLCGTPYDSGGSTKEQGISKAGNARIRRLLVEASWCWMRYQPNSALTQWFNERFRLGGRMRKIGIVAVARRLLIALWKFAKFGEIPKGARLKGELQPAA